MQTEIGFLLELVLNQKLSREAKRICMERIKEVESTLQKPNQPQFRIAQQVEQTAPAPISMPNRIVGGEIATGPGTKGPRKF